MGELVAVDAVGQAPLRIGTSNPDVTPVLDDGSGVKIGELVPDLRGYPGQRLRHPLGGYFTCRPYRITSNGDGRLRLHFASGEVSVIDASDLLDVEVAT